MRTLKNLLAGLLCLLVLAAAPSAEATILYTGGEDVDFACVTGASCSNSTTTSDFRTAWARVAYGTSNGAVADPPTNRFQTPTFTANATLWIHFQNCWGNAHCNATGALLASNAQLLRIMDSLGNPTLIVRGTGSGTQVKISSRTSGGAFTDLVTCNGAKTAANTLDQWDLYVNYSSSGEVTLFVNSVQVCDYTGNVTNGDGATTLNQLEFSFAGNLNWSAWISEIVVATTDTRAMSLLTMEGSTSGNATQWSNSSGSTPCSSLLGQTAINDTNYVYTGSNTQIEQCAIKFGNGNAAPAAGIYNVLAVGMSARTLVGASGPQHFDFVTRTGGSDYLSSDFAPINSFSNFNNYLQTVNPATSNPWSVTDLTAAGFNIGLESKP